MTEETETGVWKQLARLSWWGAAAGWLRRQFTLTSLLTIAGLVCAGGWYLVSLRTEVIVLRTEVVPVLQDSARLNALDARLSKLEGEWAVADREAHTTPTPTKHK